jgi:hypothetical protein
MLGAFLIPIGMSSLRGLTHVITCEDEAKTPFSIIIQPDGEPTLTSSTRITRASESEKLCSGLTLNISVRSIGSDQIEVRVPITNLSASQWRGTVRLRLGREPIPIDIGIIDAGATETDVVTLTLEPGTLQLNGSLLLGP